MPNPRKPTKLKILQGTFRKHRAPKNEAAPAESKQTNPPAWMRGYWRRRAWREFSKVLSENGLLTELDKWALEMLVTDYAKWREAQEKAKLGVITSDSGYVQINPLIAVERQYHRMVLELMSKFGMTPGDRSGINLPGLEEKKEEDVIEKMYRGLGNKPPEKD